MPSTTHRNDNQPPPQRYVVHAAGEGPEHRQVVLSRSFEAAAVDYLEHADPPCDAAGGISIVVVEDETGQERCFRIELNDGHLHACH
jgi:hypothetical protein